MATEIELNARVQSHKETVLRVSGTCELPKELYDTSEVANCLSEFFRTAQPKDISHVIGTPDQPAVFFTAESPIQPTQCQVSPQLPILRQPRMRIPRLRTKPDVPPTLETYRVTPPVSEEEEEQRPQRAAKPVVRLFEQLDRTQGFRDDFAEHVEVGSSSSSEEEDSYQAPEVQITHLPELPDPFDFLPKRNIEQKPHGDCSYTLKPGKTYAGPVCMEKFTEFICNCAEQALNDLLGRQYHQKYSSFEAATVQALDLELFGAISTTTEKLLKMQIELIQRFSRFEIRLTSDTASLQWSGMMNEAHPCNHTPSGIAVNQSRVSRQSTTVSAMMFAGFRPTRTYRSIMQRFVHNWVKKRQATGDFTIDYSILASSLRRDVKLVQIGAMEKYMKLLLALGVNIETFFKRIEHIFSTQHL